MDYFEQRIDRDDKYHGIIVDVHLDNVRLSDGSKASITLSMMRRVSIPVLTCG